jgi:hypothetical protein
MYNSKRFIGFSPASPHHMKLKYLLIFAIAGIVLGGSRLQAAIFPRLTAEELTAQSELIIEGNIIRSWAAWDTEHKYIWTHYEVTVTDRLRGSTGAAITVSEPGGSLDGVHQQVSGAVLYSPGETAVVFLYQTPIGYWRSVGGPQGKFTVDRQGRVHVNLGAFDYVEIPGKSPGTPLALMEGLTVRDFKARVQRLAAANPFRGRQ